MLLEGVEVPDTRRDNVLHVPRHYDKVMFQCSGREEPIDIRYRIGDTEATPTIRYGLIHIRIRSANR